MVVRVWLDGFGAWLDDYRVCLNACMGFGNSFYCLFECLFGYGLWGMVEWLNGFWGMVH